MSAERADASGLSGALLNRNAERLMRSGHYKSARAVALRSGLHPSTVRGFLRTPGRSRLSTLTLVAEVLGVTSWGLLFAPWGATRVWHEQYTANRVDIALAIVDAGIPRSREGAMKLGITLQLLEGLLTLKADPTLNQLVGLAARLDMDLATLLGRGRREVFDARRKTSYGCGPLPWDERALSGEEEGSA